MTTRPIVSIHVSPGERNPIEGKFGQAKTAYGLDRIKARLKRTSESWIATILLVLNLAKLAVVAFLYPFIKYWPSFSARLLKTIFQNLWHILKKTSFIYQIDYSRQFLKYKCGVSFSTDPIYKYYVVKYISY